MEAMNLKSRIRNAYVESIHYVKLTEGWDSGINKSQVKVGSCS